MANPRRRKLRRILRTTAPAAAEEVQAPVAPVKTKKIEEAEKPSLLGKIKEKVTSTKNIKTEDN